MPADTANLPPFRPLPYRGPDIEVRRGENGAVYLTSRSPMGAQPRSIPHALDDRAAIHPERAWLKQRLPNPNPAGPGQAGLGPWREVTYGEAAKITRSLAQALLDRGLGPDAPLLILSGNSIEHALMSLAAQRISAPATPISQAYSIMSSDFAKLKHCFEAVKPKAIFVQTMDPFRKALATLPLAGVRETGGDAGERSGRQGNGLDRAGHGRQIPVHVGLDWHAETGAAEPGPDDGADRSAWRHRVAAGRPR